MGAQQSLVLDNLALVHALVSQVAAGLPRHVEREELVSAGNAALVASAASFDSGRGVPFRAYASLRIKGALIDELRAADWASRRLRPRLRELNSASAELAAQLGRPPHESELAQAVGWAPAELARLRAQADRARVLSLDGAGVEGGERLPEQAAGPERGLLRQEQLAQLHEELGRLPAKLAYLLRAHYLDGRSCEDLAAELGVTRTRIYQQHAEAKALLRRWLQERDLEPGEEQPMKCERAGKIIHRSQRAARAHIDSLRLRGGHDLRAYPCGEHWHVGHHQNELVKRIRSSLPGRARRGAPRARRTG